MLSSLSRACVAAAFFFACSTLAHAQTGSCKDPWINKAFNDNFHRAPNGSGTSGECDIQRYGAGSWTNYQDLSNRVQASTWCSDPWIGQIYRNLYNRRPNAAECNVANYGGGRWSSYMDLAALIQAAQTAIHLPAGQALVDPHGNLIDNHAAIIAPTNTYVIGAGAGNVIGAGAGNVIGAGAGNVIGAGAGNIITPRPGMVIGAGAGNFGAQRTVMSAGGKRVIVGTVVRQ